MDRDPSTSSIEDEPSSSTISDDSSQEWFDAEEKNAKDGRDNPTFNRSFETIEEAHRDEQTSLILPAVSQNLAGTSYNDSRFYGGAFNNGTGTFHTTINNHYYNAEGSTTRKRPIQQGKQPNKNTRNEDESSRNKQETRIDPEKLSKDLQDKLKIVAEEAVGETIQPIELERPIEPVESELTTDHEAEMTDYSGHLHHRKDIMKMHKPPQGNISLNEIFEHTADNARNEADRKSLNEAAKKLLIKKHGNMVAIKGQCGIGKTTLTKLLTTRILNNSLFGIKYLFYIQIRDMSQTKECSLLQFLLESCGIWKDFQDSLDSKETERFLLDQLDRPDVIIIMDGLDEGILHASIRAKPVSLHDKSSAEHFIKNILSGNVLPNAKKFITSRPHQLYDLHIDHRPLSIVKLSGICVKAQEILCYQICDEPHAKKVYEFLCEHPNISCYCHIPVYCILTIYCIHESLKESGDVNLHSITSIFCFVIDKFEKTVHIKTEGEFQPQNLAQLAWSGFLKQRIIFEDKDLESAKLNLTTSSAFLQIDANPKFKLKILGRDKKICFSHLIWQEYFSAVQLMFLSPLQEFKEHVSNFLESRWEVVTRFLFGFCNKENSAFLQKMLQSDSSDVEERKLILKNFAHQAMSNMKEISDPEMETSHFLQICEWASEANNNSLSNCLAGGLPDEITLEGTIHPNDVINVNYLLRSRQTPLVMHIGGGNILSSIKFENNCSTRFFKEFLQTMEINSNIDLGSRVDIIGSQLTDEGLKFLGQCMQHSEKSNQQTSLNLLRCEITTQGYQIISSAIRQLLYPMKQLDLSFNSIGDDEAKSISCCLHNIERLYLLRCGITSTGVKYITSSICNLQKPMKQLDLSNNSIGDDGANSISCCLHNIERLRLHNIERLRLHNIEMLDLHNIEMLFLQQCGITSTGVKYITSSICNLQTPMEYLNISRNDIRDDAIDFVNCLCCIKELWMLNCNISRSVKDMIEEAARHAGTKVII